jgi:uncharacterized membrane protein
MMTSPYNGIGRSGDWENLRPVARRHDEGMNVGYNERLLSGAAGLALGVVGLRQRRLRGLLLPIAGGLLTRAITGHCPVNRALGRNTARADRSSSMASLGEGEGIRVEQSVTIERPREEVFAFWRNFENLPRFMDHLEAVHVLDNRRSRWVAKGPAGTRVEWDAEIHNEISNELIAWRSLPGSEVDHAGSVHFSPLHDGGTQVRVILRYDPPAGKLGAGVARLFGEEPSIQVAEDLRRFKQVMEAGEVAAAGLI